MKNWFVLRTITGKEKKVKERIERNMVTDTKLKEEVARIINPTYKTVQLRRKKNGTSKVIVEKNLLPGYIIVEASNEKLNGETISKVRGVESAMNFLGGEIPTVMRKTEQEAMLAKLGEAQKIDMEDTYFVGEAITITEGPFATFTGTINSINKNKKLLSVSVKIFGRETPVDLSYHQVKRGVE
tara:strand:+ start:2829 stop:3380 length:552 start_codon:yes stop_codon:yes gene_type:complete